MGGCLTKCFARFDRRRQLLKTRYSVEKDASIEGLVQNYCKSFTFEQKAVIAELFKFENLMDEDDIQTEMTKLVTERERQLVTSKRYNTLIHEQQKQDREVDRKLQEEEEELRREEEAYYEAKREAARIAQLQREKEEAAKAVSNGPKTWTTGADGEWEIAGGEDDFEMFLESVRTRSLKATAHLRKGSNDGSNSPSTPSQQTRDRSHTEGSNSIELEWDHDEDVGLAPFRKERSSTEEDLMALTATESRESPELSESGDYEWDTEFTASEDKDTQLLLAENKLEDEPR